MASFSTLQFSLSPAVVIMILIRLTDTWSLVRRAGVVGDVRRPEAGIIQLDPLTDANIRKEFLVTQAMAGLDYEEGWTGIAEDRELGDDAEDVARGGEMAFVTVIMILVFSGCIGTVLYLGRKKNQNDESDWSDTWPADAEYGEYGNRYSGSGSSSRSHSSYSGSEYSSRESSRRSSSRYHGRRYSNHSQDPTPPADSARNSGRERQH